MVNIGTGVAPVNIVFSSSRSVALFERKKMQNTTFSVKFHHCTLSELKTEVFTLSDVLVCVSIRCADQKQHSNPDFLTKSIDNTLQTCVEIANECLQAYNRGAGVKNFVFFWSLHEFKRAVYTRFLILFVTSN